MRTETQANLALHQTYVRRGWTTGATFTRPGRMHYTPRATPKPGLLAWLLSLLGV